MPIVSEMRSPAPYMSSSAALSRSPAGEPSPMASSNRMTSATLSGRGRERPVDGAATADAGSDATSSSARR